MLGNIDSVSSRVLKEREERLKNGANCIPFGVGFLDDALSGIYPDDLILLGAKSGQGKSQLSMLIALNAARLNKRVHFFALEASEYEIERRIKYQYISDAFFAQPKKPFVNMNYMDWHYGKLDHALDVIEDDAAKRMAELKSLKVFYRTDAFTAEEFQRIFLGIKDETDLVIIDHLHYFDIEDDNENRAIKKIVKTIRDCALIANKPVVLIAHVRKIDKRFKQLIPDLEDFHGSSDIGKIATKAITIAPNFDEQTLKHRGTYMQVLKCRVDGTRTRSVALIGYNFQAQRYEPNYHLGELNSDGSEFTALPENKIPPWAKSARASDPAL